MKTVNVKIKKIGDSYASSGVFTPRPIPSGMVEERLTPGQIVKVPAEWARNHDRVEITLEEPTRPLYFKSRNHVFAWCFPSHMMRTMSRQRIDQYRAEVRTQMEAEALAELGPAPSDSEEPEAQVSLEDLKPKQKEEARSSRRR